MQGLWIERIKTYIRQVREKMSTFDAYFIRGAELYNEKRYQIAIEFFKIALRQSNAESYANYNLALAYQQVGKEDLAIEHYNIFLKDYPTDQNSLYNLGVINYKHENFEEAVKFFAESFKYKQDEENIKALTNSYLNMGDIQKATELADYVFNSDCDKNLAYYLAKIFEEKQQSVSDFTYLDKAIEIYTKLFELQHSNFDVALSISTAYSKKGDWDNAIKYCKLALELKPKSYDANSQMGLVLYCSDNMPESIEFYERAMRIKKDYKIYSNLAYAYEKAGRSEEAIQLFKELLTKFQNFPKKEEVRNHVRQLIEKDSTN